MTAHAHADCAIVGGGIIGMTQAWCLARASVEWSGMVITRSLVGDGASRYSAGLHVPYGRNPSVRQLAADSECAYLALRRSEPHLPIVDVPATAIVSEARAEQERRNFLRPSSEALDARDFVSGPAGDLVALPVDGCFHADVAAIASHYANALRTSGRVAIWEGTEVADIGVASAGATLRLVDGRRIRCRQLVLAPGPWSVSRPFGDLLSSLRIRTKRVVALHVGCVPSPQARLLLFLEEDAFLLPFHQQGYWLFSFTSTRWDVTPGFEQLALTAEDREEGLKILLRYRPDLVAACESGRAFCDAYAPVPLIAAVRPNVFYVGGSSGSGFRLAPAMAAQASRALGADACRLEGSALS